MNADFLVGKEILAWSGSKQISCIVAGYYQHKDDVYFITKDFQDQLHSLRMGLWKMEVVTRDE